MGNGASIRRNNQTKSWSYWNNIQEQRMLHFATMAMRQGINQYYNLWSKPREFREPWRQTLAEASKTLQMKRVHAKLLKPDLNEDYISILEGKLLDKHVQPSRNGVSVFISSTFTDTRVERDLLLEDVFPYLKNYCRRIGLNFNMVDLRWGVRKEKADQHQTVDLCISEVKRCSQQSIGPCFVGIIGERYGFQPIPSRISKYTFEKILRFLESIPTKDNEDERVISLLKEWYLQDTNTIDTEYVLQPVSYKYPGFLIGEKDDRQAWNNDCSDMQQALRTAVKQVLTEEEAQTYRISVTEMEIKASLEEAFVEDEHRRFFFFRSLSNFNENHSKAYKFIDKDGNNVNTDACRKLDAMKADIDNQLPSRDIYRHKLLWNPEENNCISIEENKFQLRRFCDQFCTYMVESIQTAAASMSSTNDAVYTEALHHSVFCRDKTEYFIGRKNLVENVSQYLEQPSGNRPFVVYGIGGSGKTSIMAKAYQTSLQKWEGTDLGRPVHMIRFIGISPSSSNVRDLLFSISKQICQVHGLDTSSVPSDYKKLVTKFSHLLKLASEEIPLVLFLDSLDQLSDEDDGRDLKWLPTTLPQHVHLVLSTRPSVGGCLAALRNAIQSPEFYLEVNNLTDKDKSSILDSLLESSKRSLTPPQKQLVLSSSSDGQPTALYLKLACDIALKWKSYTPIEDCFLAPTTLGLITQLFKELEGEHGEVFVSHALGYLTAARNGLSIDELLDVLSCDDMVLDDVFQYYPPPIRRLPPLLWVRLKNDLGNYLVEGSADDTVVYRWYHSLFNEVARQRYLTEIGHQLHQSLAHFFMGRWAHTPKPYRDKQTGKTKTAIRGVPEQQLILDMNRETNMTIKKDGSAVHNRRYNLRMLTELPHHLIQGNMWAEAEQIMTHIPWLEAKCRVGKTYELCLELAEASIGCIAENSKLDDFYRFIRANTHILQQNPDLICQQALNQPDSSVCCQVAKEYLKDNQDKIQCWIDISKDQAASPEILTLHHQAPVKLCVFSKKCAFLASVCEDKTLRVWRVANAEHLMTVDCDAVTVIFSTHYLWLAVAEHNAIKIFGMGQGGTCKGKLMRTISVDVDHIPALFIPKNDKDIHLVSFGKYQVYSAQTGKTIQRKQIRTRPKAVCFSPDGKSLAIVSNKIFLWSCSSEKETKNFTSDKLPSDLNNSKVAFSVDGKRLIAVLPNGSFIWSINGSSPNPIKRLSQNCLTPWIGFSPDLNIITIPEYNRLAILNLSSQNNWINLEGHAGTVTSCSFAHGANKHHTLMATSSDDKTIRIWDCSLITPSTAEKEMPTHEGAVRACVYSSDGSKAVTTSPGNSSWVWSIVTNPPRVIKILRPPHSCTVGRVACFSGDDQFVASYCSLGIDIWNLNSSTDTYDGKTITGEHRLLPYINPTHLFTVFNQDGLYSCFTPSNRPGILILYPVVSEDILTQWRVHKDNPNFYGYNPYPMEFEHGQTFQVTAAAISKSGETLASMQVPLRAHFQANEEQQFYYNASPEVILWDVITQQQIWRVELLSNLTKHHGIIFHNTGPVVLMQQKVSEMRKTTARQRRLKIEAGHLPPEEKIPEAIIRIFDLETGEIMDTYSETGEYSHLFEANQFSISNIVTGGTHLQKLKGWLLGGISNGMLNIIELATGRTATRFVLSNTKVTSFNMSYDRKFAVAGCSNGQVHFLRIAVVKGNTL